MKLYSPPPGYYDLPFTWTYDASKLTNGVTYPNQYVYLQGGYGDFVLRRIVGLSRILNPATGTYRIQDNSGKYISSAPIFSVNADDIGLAPEAWYQETGAIKFDLGIIDLPSVPSTAQLAFQGVRRMKGTPARNPTYQATPKTYTYILPASVSGPIGSWTRYWVPVTDYDFELYQIIVLESGGGQFSYVSENGGVLFTNLSPNAITLNIGTTGAQVVNVVGNVITINANLLVPNGSISTFLGFWNTSPAAALVSATVFHNQSPNSTPFYAGPVVAEILALSQFGPAGGAASLWLYDQNKVAVSSGPLVDIFMDGGPLGEYVNGALVTPVWYTKDTQIQMDVYSQTASGASLLIYFVGRQYLPCA
jgi:hypothetical protein